MMCLCVDAANGRCETTEPGGPNRFVAGGDSVRRPVLVWCWWAHARPQLEGKAGEVFDTASVYKVLFELLLLNRVGLW